MTTSLPSPDLAFSDTASQPDEHLLSIPKTSAACQASNDMKASDLSDDSDSYHMGTPASVASDKMEKPGSLDARAKISNLLKDKEQEWRAVAERKGPLRLLDLPMDVLKEIVKEVRFRRTYDNSKAEVKRALINAVELPPYSCLSGYLSRCSC